MIHLSATFKKNLDGQINPISGLILFILFCFFSKPAVSLAQVPPVTYPKVAGYVGVI